MSGTKRLMEEMEGKRYKAGAIARRAGVLAACEDHDEVFRSEKDVVEAYKLGNARFEKDSLGKTFKSRTEMTDYIKEVADDASISRSVCDKIRYE
jgi:hypothetical protein